MGVKISALPAVVTPALTDVFPIVQGGVTYKETGTQLGTLFAALGSNPTFTTVSFSPTTGGIVGTTAADNASAGIVGELKSTVVAASGAVSLTTATARNVATLSLTAGDWDIYGNVFVLGNTYNLSFVAAWCSLTSATLPDNSLYNVGNFSSSGTLFSSYGLDTPYLRVNVSTTTNVYLSCEGTFASGTASACGGIYARRVR